MGVPKQGQTLTGFVFNNIKAKARRDCSVELHNNWQRDSSQMPTRICRGTLSDGF